MLIPILFLLCTFNIIIHCSCPDGFELVRDGQCRGAYGQMKGQDHDTATPFAISKCKEIEGLPIIIHSEEDQSYWTSKLKDWAPIGMVCNTNSKQWEWVDGSTIDFKPPAINTDAEWDNCSPGISSFINRSGYWSAEHCVGCNVHDADNYCTTQLEQPARNEGCDGFEDDSDDGVCYQIGAAAETWQDAQLNCRKVGANLASVHNLQENSFIRRLAVSKGAVNGVFIGAILSGKENSLGWIDGTEWDYENFAPGFPRPGFGECFAMDTTASAGQWMNIDCAAKLPVACIREQKPIVEPLCSTEKWKEGVIITSPGFPYSASTFCDYYLMTDVGKNIELEIVFLEANTCCDSLIIYDGYLGSNVLANLTGEVRNVTYTTTASNIMRVTWHPNGGTNVMGMAMTFRGI